MIEIDKSLIKKRFSKSISTYNENASIQKLVTERLALLIDSLGINQYHSVLELGCGTGMLTEQLLSKFEIKEMTCNDLVGEFITPLKNVVNKYNVNFKFIEGDLEQTDNYHSNYDLISSASTLQWILELDALFEKLNCMLNKNGVFAFATFGPKNFIEIREITNSGLLYTPFEKIKYLIEKRFDLIHISEEICPIYFDNSIDILKHIKSTGVNAVIQTTFNKSDFLVFDNKYNDNFRSKKGLRLSYHPIYLVAKKIASST